MKAFKLILNSAIPTICLLTSNASDAQYLPLKMGINYEDAREKLIEQGWRPHVPSGIQNLSCGDKEPCTYKGLETSEEAKDSFFKTEIGLRQVFRDQGWYEAVHCYPTGAGWCYHSFTNANGQELVVRTGSGAYKKIPPVNQFFFVQ